MERFDSYSADDAAPLRTPGERLPSRPAAREQSRGSISTGRWMWEWVKAITTAIVLFLLIRTFVVEAFKIPTGSMENTLLVGDFLLVNKAVYGAEIPISGSRLPGYRRPQRGDVIVFLPPHDPAKNYVKRIVGLPGDTLEMREKTVYLNGAAQAEPFARHLDYFGDPADVRMGWQAEYLADPSRRLGYRPSRDNWGPIVVPSGRYFALGDNRDNSEDSRYWGFLDSDAVKGRPILVYYSFQYDRAHALPWLTDVRWSRIGSLID
jgi:signal peptidase I